MQSTRHNFCCNPRSHFLIAAVFKREGTSAQFLFLKKSSVQPEGAQGAMAAVGRPSPCRPRGDPRSPPVPARRSPASPAPAGPTAAARKRSSSPARAGEMVLATSRLSTSRLARANCYAETFVTGAGAFAAVKCPGNTFLRRSRDRQEDQGEASHLCREIREMPEPRETGYPATQPHRNLSVLCVKKGFVQRSKRTEESNN